MSSYRMNIQFKEEDLLAIAKAHQKVVLVKHTVTDSDSSVAWVSFKPHLQNTVDWENTYAIYSSNSEVQNKATINKLSDKMATSGIQYDFADGTFGTPKIADVNVMPNTYYVKNNEDDYPVITVGLAQNVVVNGEAKASKPINAVNIPYGQTVSITPLEMIDVCLLNDITESAVITHDRSVSFQVIYRDGETTHSVAYNGKIGQFYLEA